MGREMKAMELWIGQFGGEQFDRMRGYDGIVGELNGQKQLEGVRTDRSFKMHLNRDIIKVLLAYRGPAVYIGHSQALPTPNRPLPNPPTQPVPPYSNLPIPPNNPTHRRPPSTTFTLNYSSPKTIIVYNILMREEKQNTSMEGEAADHHHFQLRRTGAAAHAPKVQVDFSPEPATAHPQRPTFNSDRLYFTPCFVLPSEQAKSVKQSETYLSLHHARKQELSEEKQELLVPKPSRSNSFCCICKTTFEDYLTHVNIPAHTQAMRSSPFCQDISSLVSRLHPTPPSHKPLAPRPKKIRKLPRKRQLCGKMSSLSSTTLIQEEFDSQFQQAV